MLAEKQNLLSRIAEVIRLFADEGVAVGGGVRASVPG